MPRGRPPKNADMVSTKGDRTDRQIEADLKEARRWMKERERVTFNKTLRCYRYKKSRK